MALTLPKTHDNSTEFIQEWAAKYQRALGNVIFIAAGLVIKAATSPLAKSANAVYGFGDGTLFTKAAADMAALSGTTTNALFNVYVFSTDKAGTLVTTAGTEGATLADVVFPTLATDEAIIGFVVINPTGTGNFVGGTTDIDDATVVPNAVFVDTPFPFSPESFDLTPS